MTESTRSASLRAATVRAREAKPLPEGRGCDPSLLVSVRSAAEAAAALLGGAGLIDIKEPSRGSLGRASNETIGAVIAQVAGQQPISAALGELREGPRVELPVHVANLSYVKWGLAHCDGNGCAWQTELGIAVSRLAERTTHCRAVAVAYADWRRAGAPTPAAVCDFAQNGLFGALLLDTWEKDGSSLLDWMDLNQINNLCRSCRQAGLPIALAGSLDLQQIRHLRPIAPDWFAVRGAACQRSARLTVIEEGRVRQLATLLAEPIHRTTSES